MELRDNALLFICMSKEGIELLATFRICDCTGIIVADDVATEMEIIVNIYIFLGW